MALHVQGLPNELNRLTDAKMKVSVGVVFVVSFLFGRGVALSLPKLDVIQ